MAPGRFVQQKSLARPRWLDICQHGEDTAPLTLARQTSIRMPNLHCEESFGALFILEEDVPKEMIDKVLEKVAEEHAGYHSLWLVDDSLEEIPGAEEGRSTTEPPIPSTWRSPFIGKPVEAAFKYLATIPLDRSVMRGYIAVLDRHLYEKKGWLVLYKIDDEGEITSIPCAARFSMLQMVSYNQDLWPVALRDWRERGKPVL